jgi:hypothetical protein
MLCSYMYHMLLILLLDKTFDLCWKKCGQPKYFAFECEADPNTFYVISTI